MQLLAIFRKSPFSRLLFLYAAGILTDHFVNGLNMISFRILAVILILLLAILLAIIRWHISFQTCWIAGLLSGLVLFIAGFVNMEIRNQHAIRESSKAEILGFCVLQIADTPEIREKTVKATAKLKWSKTNGELKGEHLKIMILIERDSSAEELKYGDWLIANTRISNVSPPGNPGEFDYGRYMAARNIYKQAYLMSGNWTVSKKYDGKNLQSIAYQLQGNLLKAYQGIGMNKTLYGILAALTVGYRNDLDASTKQSFSQAGVMHVMALSGFNVAIIALALGYMLRIFERIDPGKVFRTSIIILVIWLFAFVTGLSPSVTRAAVMISFVMTGKLLNRQVNTYNILFASAFFLLAFSPSLLTDVSFQLSFAAVMGILVYQPILYRFLLFKNLLADRTWKLFTVSCAAQLATLPLTLYYFHQFPVYFWLTNLYVVPLVSVIIVVAGVFLLVSFIHPLALILGKILVVLLDGLYRTVSATEMLPCALLENIHISIHQTLLLVLLTLFLGLFFLHRNLKLLLLSMALLLIFQLMNIAHNLDVINQQAILVSKLKGVSALSFISARNAVLYTDSVLSPRNKAVQYALSNFWIERGVSSHILFLSDLKHAGDEISRMGSTCLFPWLGNNLLVESSGLRIAILQDNQFKKYHSPDKLKVDLVILSGKVKPDLEKVIGLLETDLLILDSSVKRFQALQWEEACESLSIPCWNVSDKGAYVLRYKKKSASIYK
jgi:competence protein ComEC